MEIKVNGSPQKIEANTTLKDFVGSILQDTKGVAIAINNMVIAKSLWSETTLSENDNILFIKATQGG